MNGLPKRFGFDLDNTLIDYSVAVQKYCLNEGLNEGLNSMLTAIIHNPGIQAKQLSDILGARPLKTIERQIKQNNYYNTL